MALAAKGRLDEAQANLSELRTLISQVPPAEKASNNSTRAVLGVGAKALEARIAQARKDPRALALWTDAVALEDSLVYAEPADWFYPLRQLQGTALLEAGKPREAEAVFRADLAKHPKNGWALSGLAQSLRAQNKPRQAKRVETQLARAWKQADTTTLQAAR